MDRPLLQIDEDLVRRLPLPLAQLYRRAHNAKNALERHQSAYYLWEASLKLLAAVAVIEYIELNDDDPDLAQRMQNLARPALGHWWEFVRRLVPVLADAGDEPFSRVRDLALGRSRDDLPRAAALQGMLLDLADPKRRALSTVRLSELFDGLVKYRNDYIGHGAAGQQRDRFYDRMGRALLAGVSEILTRLDPLAERKLIYVAGVRRLNSGDWLIEQFELHGETARRLEPAQRTAAQSHQLPTPECVYLADPTASDSPPARLLHPLLTFDAETGETFFLNARRQKRVAEYLCYSTGRVLKRDDLAKEQRKLLARALGQAVDENAVEDWQARSQAEETDKSDDLGPAPRMIGEFELLSRIGRGGMGIVYRAWQPSLGRQVALKCLLRWGDPKAEARFAREIRALGRVDHPNLIKIYTSGAEEDQWFYAMELVEGADLGSICEQLAGSDIVQVTAETWRRALTTAYEQARSREQSLSEDRGASRRAARAAPEPEAAPDEHGSPPTAEGAHALHAAQGGREYVAQVVDIVRQVAEAAHALHESGVIHRDIKPGNIMLARDGGHVVLMDLGLAQLADDLQGRLTRTRQFVGTLRYASPEQVLAVANIDRRSDVYSLGATLWELLTLRPLYGANDQTPTPELMLKIQETDPERPRRYNPRIPKDLEAIVQKCLARERSRRYATAAELAEDLGRWLRGEPVAAQPPTLRYLAVKFVQKHRLRVATATAILLFSLIAVGPWREGRWAAAAAIGLFGVSAAVAAFVWINRARLDAVRAQQEAIRSRDEAVRAKREAQAAHSEALAARDEATAERELADRARTQAEAIRKFYEENILAAARPKGWSGGAGKDVTLKEALDQAADKIEPAFAGQPELEAAVRDALGMTYWHLGEFSAAAPHLEQACAIRRGTLGEDHVDTLTSLQNLAMQRWKRGQLSEAITLGRQALAVRQRQLGREHEDTLWTQLNLGLFLWEAGELDEAESILRDAVGLCDRTLGADHHHTLYGRNDLACVLGARGRFQEALLLDRETLEGRRRALGPEHPDTLRSMGNLAYDLSNCGDYEGAYELWRQTLVIQQRVIGPEHAETLLTQHNIAWSLELQGKIKEAEELGRQTFETRRRVQGADHRTTLLTQKNLARAIGKLGDVAGAESLMRDALERQQRAMGAEHLDCAFTLADLGVLLIDQGRTLEAEPLLRECLAIRQKKLTPGNWQIFNTQSLLGDCLARQRRFAEAEALLLEGFQGLVHAALAPAERIVQARDRLVDLYQQWDKPALAETWRQHPAAAAPQMHSSAPSNLPAVPVVVGGR